jgi:proliferating cell nuclear antigen
MVSDHVTFSIDEERAAFYVEAAGDTDDVSLALPAEELVEFTPGDARSLFSIDYLKAIERAMPRDLELDLQLGTNVPLSVRYAFAEGASSVEYLVSPRITAN